MKHPQTWSISIACIGSVMLAIGIALVSTSESMDDTDLTQPVGILPEEIVKSDNQQATDTQKKDLPITTRRNYLEALEVSISDRPSLQAPTMRHYAVQPGTSSIRNSKKNIDIDCLLEQASTDIADLRLTLPQGNNAWEKLQLVLQTDATNSVARDSLRFIMSTYVHMAKSARSEGNEKLQGHYLDQIHLVLYGEKNTRGQVSSGVASLVMARK